MAWSMLAPARAPLGWACPNSSRRWLSSTSDIRPLTAPRIAASCCSPGPQSAPASNARSNASVWPRIEGKKDLVKQEVIWNAEKGLKLGGPEIAEARRVQGAITNRLMGYFERHDFLLLPTAVSPPFDHRMRYLEEIGGRRFDTYISWLVLTFAITLTGTPALSIPAGFTRSGLPVGLQVVARPRGEAELLAFCAILEAELGLAGRVPVDPIAGAAP